MINYDYAVVTTTFPTQESAAAIARDLVDRRLAACVQVSEVESIFRWDMRTQVEAEWLLTIKTSARHVDDLREVVLSAHPYTVSEFLVFEVKQGSSSYLEWIAESTERS